MIRCTIAGVDGRLSFENARKVRSWALVTGASDGIGREFAFAIAKAGINLILVARREDALCDVASQIKARSKVDVAILPFDLGDHNAVRGLVQAVGDRDIGLLVAAAGFGTSGPFEESELESELAMVDVNCRSVVELVRRSPNGSQSVGGAASS